MVVIDDRDTYGGGRYKASYSGHQMYYKRGAGGPKEGYALKDMYKVKDADELRRLVNRKDADLPPAARPPAGWPPRGKARKELVVDARKAHKSRNSTRQKARAAGKYKW